MTMGAKPTTEPLPDGGGETMQSAEARPPWRRLAFLGLWLAVLLAVVYLSPVKAYLGHLQELRDTVRSLGLLGPVVLTLSIAVLVALGFPRLLFCVVAGMAMGFWWGLLWAQLGTMLGNYSLFLLARTSGGDWVRRYVAKRRRLASLVYREGVAGVILARQLPLPGVVTNLAFGLLAVRHRDFLLGTLVGQLPEAIPCTLVGAGAVRGSFAQSAGLIGLAVILAVLVWVGLRWFIRARLRQPGRSESKTMPL